jgi:hypothetical protein
MKPSADHEVVDAEFLSTATFVDGDFNVGKNFFSSTSSESRLELRCQS